MGKRHLSQAAKMRGVFAIFVELRNLVVTGFQLNVKLKSFVGDKSGVSKLGMCLTG